MAQKIFDDLNLLGHKIAGMANPTGAQDAATKDYVDSTHGAATQGDIILAVSPSGTDTTGIITNGDHSSTPFLTIDGALNALPLYNIFDIVIRVAAGTYAKWKPRAFVGGGSCRIIGATAVSTVSTGAASGTMGAGSTINADLTATVFKPTAAANWTPGNLRGKYVLITGGTGFQSGADAYAIGCIGSNTTTSATVAFFVAAGVGFSGSFSTSIDATTTFQIVDPGAIITPVLGGSDNAQLNYSSATSTVGLERLGFTGAGDETDNVIGFSACTAVTLIACGFDCQSTECGAIGGASISNLQMFACHINGGTACNVGQSGFIFAYGNVLDNALAFIANYCINVAGGNNFADMANSGHGDAYLWEVTGCNNFQEGSSRVTNTLLSVFSIQGCANVGLYGAMTLSGITGYGAIVSGVCSIVTDNKTLAGTAGAFLLDDTVVSLSSAVTNDRFVRGLCEIQYVGP